MDNCECGTEGDSDAHYEKIEEINLEIERLRYSEPHETVKPTVISLINEKIDITECLGDDSSYIQEQLEEYEATPGIKYSTQWSSSRNWSGGSHGVNKR